MYIDCIDYINKKYTKFDARKDDFISDIFCLQSSVELHLWDTWGNLLFIMEECCPSFTIVTILYQFLILLSVEQLVSHENLY